jgi:long-chain acyl-CoA synthetase
VNHPKNWPDTDPIPLEETPSLASALAARIRRSPKTLAYRQYDPVSGGWVNTDWEQMGGETARWRAALAREGLGRGDRVAMALRNCREWACFDLAAQSLGLVTVPLYTNDRPDHLAYILAHSDSRLVLLDSSELHASMREALRGLPGLQRILTLEPVVDESATTVADWLPEQAGEFQVDPIDPHALATIVYTSGTTGRPKGVMLSHRNILSNAHSGLHSVAVYPHDLFLSFLPLSHTLERTVGFYLPLIAGAAVAYARSVSQLAEDLQSVRPTILIAVPRIFERIYGRLQDKLAHEPALARFLFAKAAAVGWQRFLHAQGRAPRTPAMALWPLLDRLAASKVRARLGGRLRFAVCGGAPLSSEIAQLFIGLGLTIAQGYGLTEYSPIVSGNLLEDNRPDSVGIPFLGAEVRIGEQDEILVRGPSVMQGYWKEPEASAAAVDRDGWLHTGDKGRLERGHLYITGRIKEIIVLANGEKVSPGDMEMAVALDPLFEQVLVVGEGRPYLTALIVPDPEAYERLLRELALPPDTGFDHPRVNEAVLQRVAERLRHFPGYARIVAVRLIREAWTIGNDLMTPTMKLRRGRILRRHAAELEQLYQGYR